MSFIPQTGPATRPAWMFGLSPEYFTLGCGVMAFDKAGLEAFRMRCGGEAGAVMASTLKSLETQGIRIPDPELKRVPAPWPGDHPNASLLRRKGLVGWIDQPSPRDGIGPEGAGRAMAAFGHLRPLFDLLMTG